MGEQRDDGLYVRLARLTWCQDRIVHRLVLGRAGETCRTGDELLGDRLACVFPIGIVRNRIEGAHEGVAVTVALERAEPCAGIVPAIGG